MSATLPQRSHHARFYVLGWLLLAAAPVAFIASQVLLTSRNVPFWDDYDSVLGFLLHLDSGATWGDFFQRLFRFDSGHRTVTSRLLFVGSYWLTGGVNFHFINAVGNLTLVGLCALLIARTAGTAERVRMGVVLALGLFHLQHYEPFLWGGASIDHFQILLLAGGSLAALTMQSRNAVAAATLLAVLATFTLAHGCVVWPVGAFVLAHQRRWRVLGFWGGFAAAALAVFLHGFTLNPAHVSGDFSAAGLARLMQFWLALLGGPLALGDRVHDRDPDPAPCAQFLGYGVGRAGPDRPDSRTFAHRPCRSGDAACIDNRELCRRSARLAQKEAQLEWLCVAILRQFEAPRGFRSDHI